MKFKARSFTFSALAAGCLVSSCFASARADADTPGVSDTQIIVGTSIPLTGPSAPYGKSVVQGIESCFKRVNDHGGINGRKLKLIAYDDRYEPAQTLANVTTLINQDHAFALLSVFGGQGTAVIVPTVEQRGVPLIGPVTVANLVTPVRRHVFAVRSNAYMEAGDLIQRLKKDLDITDVGVFFQEDALGRTTIDAVKIALEKEHATVKVAANFNRNSADVAAGIKAIAAKTPKVIYLAGLMPATGNFVKGVVTEAYAPIFIGGTPVTTAEFAKEIGTTKARYFGFTATPLVTDKTSDFIRQYSTDMKSAGYDDLQQFGADAYLSSLIFVEGLKRAGKTFDRGSFEKAVETFQAVSFGGVSISYSATDHQGIKAPFLSEVRAGMLTPTTSLKN